MNKVEKLFADRAIVRGGIRLLSRGDAISYVEACRQYEVLVLGIDAFYLFENKVQPSMKDSIDFSSRYYVEKTNDVYSDAIDFLIERSTDLFFEVVCAEEDESQMD